MSAEPTFERTQELVGMFHLLGDANQLHLIRTFLEEEVCVQDMADRSSLAPLVSHHLRLLETARLMRPSDTANRCSTRSTLSKCAVCFAT